jgi:F-type H+-transporting ATPase subunit delta
VSETAVARRYARAIFELGVEEGQLHDLTAQITDFAAAYAGSSELGAVLANPLVSHEEREQVLLAVAQRLGLAGLALNAVRLIAARRRLGVLPEIARLLARMADEQNSVVRAIVTSAVPLSAQYVASLEKELAAMTQKSIVIEHRQDSSLVAGLVTQIGDNTIDGSIQGRLAELERQLLHA